MPILEWKNFNEIMSIRDEVDRLFDRIFEKSSFHSWEEKYAFMSSGGPSPEFNVHHRDEDIAIRVDLPGYERGDIKVSVSGNLLAIGCEVSREREFRGSAAYRYHRSHGSFCKVMELPAGVDADGIRTSFSDGVLEITLPKGKREPSSEIRVPIETELALPSESPPEDIDETS